VSTIPTDANGAPLWDAREWGTVGPPWRATLTGQVEARSAADGPWESLEASLGINPVAAVVDRFIGQLREEGHSPARAQQIARQCAERHDRKNA
jgi:hypothetical protein